MLLPLGAFAAYPSARNNGSMVYSAEAGKIILFGGVTDRDVNNVLHELDETWQWTGRRWAQMYPDHSPSPRAAFGMVYDSNRDRIVLFGGEKDSDVYNDTWVFANGDWSELSPATQPPARQLPAMAFDPVQDRILMFGGTTKEGVLYDTWAFDGTNWQLIETDGPHLLVPTMVYDAARDEILMVGRGDDGTPAMYHRTSEGWESLQPETMPQCVGSAHMVYRERHRDVLIYGGRCVTGTFLNTTTLWDGENWTDVETETSAGRTAAYALAYDPRTDQTVLYGGTSGTSINETYLFQQGQTVGWTNVSDTVEPGPRTLFVFAPRPEQGDILFFGGQNSDRSFSDLWSYSSGRWNQITTDTSVGLCDKPAGAWNPDTQKLNVFCTDSATLWQFDGTDWAKVTATGGPTSRLFASMVYDPVHKQMVVFGGWDGYEYRNDVWTFDGTTWKKLSKKGDWPDGRVLTAMFWDETLQKIVIFGGLGRKDVYDLVKRYDDTWTFDGTGWSKLDPATHPDPSYGFQVGRDPQTGHMILFGGVDDEVHYSNQQWSWNGTNWTELNAANPPSARQNGRMAVDPSTGKLTLYGGYAGVYFSQLWTFEGDHWELHPALSGRRRAAAAPGDGN